MKLTNNEFAEHLQEDARQQSYRARDKIEALERELAEAKKSIEAWELGEIAMEPSIGHQRFMDAYHETAKYTISKRHAAEAARLLEQ